MVVQTHSETVATARRGRSISAPVILLCGILMCCSSGCMRYLGLSHSSLTPRTASVLADEPLIVRSQDRENESTADAATSPDTTTSFGHSIGLGANPFVGSQDTQAANLKTVRHAGDYVSPGGHSQSTGVVAGTTIDAAARQMRSQVSPVKLGRPILQVSVANDGAVAQQNIEGQIPGGGARLLMPDFSSATAAAQYQSVQTTNSAAPATGTIRNNGAPAAGPEGSAAPGDSPAAAANRLSADAIRSLINQQSRNDMSEGAVLADQKPEWPVENLQVDSNEPTQSDQPKEAAVVGQLSVPDNSLIQQADSPTREAASNLPPGEIESDDSASVTAVPEPSMLDRLRGMYALPESQSLRPRWKLPSPFNVFREKEDAADVPTTTAEAVSPLLPDEVSSAVPEDVRSERQKQLEVLIDLWQSELQALQQTGGRAAEREEWIRRQQDLRLLQLLAADSDSALTSISGLPAGEQEFWQELMLALAQYRDADGQMSRRERLTQTVGQLRSAVKHVIPETRLLIKRIDLCSEIYSFGRIEPLPSHTFDPGAPVLLYVEVDNFSTRTTVDGSYETDFAAQLGFYAEGDTEAIQSTDVNSITDTATSERFDYYQTFELTIPAHLKAGSYEIRLKLADQHSQRTVDAVVPFQVR